MNIELTQEQVEAFNRGESITITPKPKQWEPRYDMRYRRSTFSARDTLEADSKSYRDIRTHNRLLAYVDEFGGDWVADWNDRGQFKHYVLYSIPEQKYSHQGVCLGRHIGAVYMSLECAQGLIAKLESGEVVL